MNKKIMGKISFGYSDLVMPLEVAHKIQALLAEHADKMDRIYAASGHVPVLQVLRKYEVGSVEVVADKIDFDARDVDDAAYTGWQSAIRDREKNEIVMSPQDFAKIKGGE